MKYLIAERTNIKICLQMIEGYCSVEQWPFMYIYCDYCRLNARFQFSTKIPQTLSFFSFRYSLILVKRTKAVYFGKSFTKIRDYITSIFSVPNFYQPLTSSTSFDRQNSLSVIFRLVQRIFEQQHQYQYRTFTPRVKCKQH